MTRRLRIVHVTGCLDMGGQEKLLLDFARHMDRDYFDLRFVSLGTRGVLADDLELLGWPVTALGCSPGVHTSLPFQLAKMFRKWRLDIVHTHNQRPLIYAAPAARLARIAGLIHTKHGRETGKTLRQNVMNLLAARLTDCFACVSQDCARLAVHQGTAAKRVRCIHNGIDLQHFAETGPCLKGPAVVVARLCPEKDHATLLKAVALVVPSAPQFRLCIVGAGPCLPELQNLVSRLNLTSHVQFLGAIRDVRGILHQARMKVLSSTSEGLPLTLLEAMASGLPVVATQVGGTSEVVLEAQTGLLVPPRDPAALADALLRLQLDDSMVHRFGQSGRRRIEQAFDVQCMVKSYEHLYFQTLHGKRTKQYRHNDHAYLSN